jgi:hypothetical protein
MFMFVTNQNNSPKTKNKFITIGTMINGNAISGRLLHRVIINGNTISGRLLHQGIYRNISLNLENHDLGKLFKTRYILFFGHVPQWREVHSVRGE